MSDFEVVVDIDAPPARVWEVMVDVERWHEWTPSVRGITLWGGRPLAVGTWALVRQPRFPPAVWRVTAIEPGRSFIWVSVGPALRVTGHHAVSPRGTGARATLSLTYAGFLGRALARWTRDITRRYVEMEAVGLMRRSDGEPVLASRPGDGAPSNGDAGAH